MTWDKPPKPSTTDIAIFKKVVILFIILVFSAIIMLRFVIPWLQDVFQFQTVSLGDLLAYAS